MVEGGGSVTIVALAHSATPAAPARLEFATAIDAIEANRVDLSRCDDAGRVVDLEAMIRPLKAMNLVHAKMGEMLARLRAARRGA